MAKKLFTDMLRDAIRAAFVTRAQIARDTGVLEPQLSRFLSKSIGLSQHTIDTLVEYLDLELKPRQSKGK